MIFSMLLNLAADAPFASYAAASAHPAVRLDVKREEPAQLGACLYGPWRLVMTRLYSLADFCMCASLDVSIQQGML